MTTSPPASQGRAHAVVIGASITGLLTARVLADHFERVTVIDQDELPEGPSTRRGAPQANHIHILLARGCEILEQLFPGVIAELVSHGAITFDYGQQVCFEFQGFEVPRFHAGIHTVTSSRALLEWCLRSRLNAMPQVTLRTDSSVTGLHTEGGRQARGVKLRQDPDTEQVLEADLVVDASGRGSHATQWLEALGRPPPPEQVIRPGLTYATRWYREPSRRQVERLGDWVIVVSSASFPGNPYSGALCRVEGGRMIATLMGTGYHAMPQDEAGFLARARALRLPVIAELLADSEPLSPVHTFRGAINRWRHYEQVPDWPEGFAVLGDAACVFNPAYGQGMTVAGLSALLLGTCLKEGGARVCQTFQQRLAGLQQVPWDMVRGDDSLWEQGDQSPIKQRVLGQARAQILRSLFSTEAGIQRFLEIMHMLRPPETMLEDGGLAMVGRGLAKRLTSVALHRS